MSQFNATFVEDGVCVVEVSGEIDLAVTDELLEVARAGLREAGALRLDLSGVSFIDSTGLGTLVLIRNEAAAADKALTLANVPVSVARLLQLTGLSGAFDIDDASVGGDTPVDRP